MEMPRLLTEREVIEARQMYLRGNVSMSYLANEYGLTKAGMQVVLNSTNWRELLREGEEQALAKARADRRMTKRHNRRNGERHG
jgi:hypothetical protein